MPSKKDFKHFKPCAIEGCEGKVGGRTLKELGKKLYCSNSCSASVRKSTVSHSDKMKAQVERQYKMMHNNPEKYIHHLLQKPERRQLSTNYLLEMLGKQGGNCAISGIEMTFEKVPGKPKVHTNLSIDRIDSQIGYEIGNVHLVCAIVNIMKSTLTLMELQEWCSAIIDNSKEK